MAKTNPSRLIRDTANSEVSLPASPSDAPETASRKPAFATFDIEHLIKLRRLVLRQEHVDQILSHRFSVCTKKGSL